MTFFISNRIPKMKNSKSSIPISIFCKKLFVLKIWCVHEIVEDRTVLLYFYYFRPVNILNISNAAELIDK